MSHGVILLIKIIKKKIGNHEKSEVTFFKTPFFAFEIIVIKFSQFLKVLIDRNERLVQIQSEVVDWPNVTFSRCDTLEFRRISKKKKHLK